jgi:hypothetical protein
MVIGGEYSDQGNGHHTHPKEEVYQVWKVKDGGNGRESLWKIRRKCKSIPLGIIISGRR